MLMQAGACVSSCACVCQGTYKTCGYKTTWMLDLEVHVDAHANAYVDCLQPHVCPLTRSDTYNYTHTHTHVQARACFLMGAHVRLCIPHVMRPP